MEKVAIFKKEVRYSLFRRNVTLTMSDVFSGIVFLLMGALLLYYSLTNQITMTSSESGLWVNILMSQATDAINQFISSISGQMIVLGIIIALFAWIIKKVAAKYREKMQ